LSHWKNGAPSTAQARIPMDPDDHRSIYPNIYKCVPADLLILGEGFGGERSKMGEDEDEEVASSSKLRGSSLMSRRACHGPGENEGCEATGPLPYIRPGSTPAPPSASFTYVCAPRGLKVWRLSHSRQAEKRDQRENRRLQITRGRGRCEQRTTHTTSLTWIGWFRFVCECVVSAVYPSSQLWICVGAWMGIGMGWSLV
jgi:hypothetical protein